MSTYTWVGGHSGNAASDPLNWSPNGLPTAGDTINVLDNNTLVLINGALSNNIISVSGPSTTINETGVITSNDTVTVESGVVWNMTGTPTLNAGGTIINGSSVTTGSTITGDIDTFGSNDTLNLVDTIINNANISFSSGDTLNLTGSMAGSMAIDPNSNGGINQSWIHQTGSADAVTINATGTVTNDGFLWVDSPGGTTTLNIQNNGTSQGLYFSDGPLLVAGGTLVVNGGTPNGREQQHHLP
jgi:hypothetical protein